MSSQQLSFASTIDVLREYVPESLMHPVLGIVCGSGLHTLVTNLQESVSVPYDSIPGFGQSTGESIMIIYQVCIRVESYTPVPGHKSSLAFGYLGPSPRRIPVVAMLGRVCLLHFNTLQSPKYV